MSNQLKINDCSIKDVKLFKNIVHNDNRGSFLESFRQSFFNNNVHEVNFLQDNMVYSKKNVLRGLHYQKDNPQGKLVTAVYGEIFDVAVDIRENSKTFGKWVGELLSDKNHHQLYIPPGFAHGYCVLSDYAIVTYKCTNYFYKDDQYGIIWNDKKIKIDWPIENPILSEKDSKLPQLNLVKL